MSGTYLTWLADAYRAAGLRVVEYDGWRTRARSSGGFAGGRPVCTMWHHTASRTSPQSDADFMCRNSSDRPIANVLVARDGTVWVLAAGATNTNGRGNSLRFSTGTVPADSMNTWAIGVEIANNGVGETYPQAQADAMFTVSNVHAARLGWRPDDLAGHVDYTSRKIDPAVNIVAGPWAPRSINSSRSWNVADTRAEAIRRATTQPQEDDMTDEQARQLQQIFDGVVSIQANIWGTDAPTGPPYPQSIYGRLERIEATANDTLSGVVSLQANTWGGANDDPPQRLSVLGRLDAIERNLGIDPWAGLEGQP